MLDSTVPQICTIPNRLVQRIILVGGFGDSEYLRQELAKHFELAGRITITVPDNP